MTDIEPKFKASVSAIWTAAVLDGEPARVSIVNGRARIRVNWFDICVLGKFDGCVEDVIAAYERQVEETEKAFRNLPDDSDKPTVCDDSCELQPISEAELDQQIEEFMKNRGRVIDLFSGEWQ